MRQSGIYEGASDMAPKLFKTPPSELDSIISAIYFALDDNKYRQSMLQSNAGS